MKKRLLSAALALAMVLTLIPATVVPAFAADWTTAEGNHTPVGVTYTTGSGANEKTDYYFKQNANFDVNNPSYTTVTVSLCTQTNTSDNRQYGHWYWQKNKGNGHYSICLLKIDI